MARTGSERLRPATRVIRGLDTTDGAGVHLTRFIGTPEIDSLDPFLLLDAFHSDEPDRYMAGFPDHPHRGFQTITYLLAGRMRHRDNAGHEGVIGTGGLQWMSAGSGIIHSEMPEQTEGLLFGLQLWVNLPAAQKMTPPRYRDIAAAEVPAEMREGATIRVIAGKSSGGVRGVLEDLTIPANYLDVSLVPGASLREPVPEDHNGFVLLLDGTVQLLAAEGEHPLAARALAVLGEGDTVAIRAGDTGARLLLVSGQPINEPVARQGPFVMNTRDELAQAFRDLREGRI